MDVVVALTLVLVGLVPLALGRVWLRRRGERWLETLRYTCSLLAAATGLVVFGLLPRWSAPGWIQTGVFGLMGVFLLSAFACWLRLKSASPA